MPVHDWTSVVAGNFHDFHQTWIMAIRDALNDGLLPAEFYAMAEQRAKGPIPDILTLESLPPPTDLRPLGSASAQHGGTLLLEESPPRVRFTDENDDAWLYAERADQVVIRHANGDRVVAFVEIVSPGNKNSLAAIESYSDKLRESLLRGCQFLMIDILPPGRHDPEGLHAAVWPVASSACVVTADEPFGLASYRSEGHPQVFFERCGAGQALPEMPLFLTTSRYLNVPLELTYQRAWNSVPARWRRVMAPEEFS